MKVPELLVEGKALRLGARIGKGGEGEVYKVEDRSNCALKLYTLKDTAARESKIEAMIRSRIAETSGFAAFPFASAHLKDGRFAGFLMNLVTGHKPIHELYSPAARKRAFSQADYRFLVRAASNVARAVASVHSSNCVIGDINHSGILISDQATAALIDADSFQITDGSKHYLCKVGVPEYTPPELQGMRLSDIVRSADHDAFGLAVVIFQLLCMGRHPFSGAYTSGEMPIERAIREYRYAYTRVRSVGMTPPPGSIDLAVFPKEVVDAFEKAFDKNSVGGRPTAEQWVSILKSLEQTLVRCNDHELHFYPSGSSHCPWCKMERHHGMVLFLRQLNYQGSGSTTAFDLASAWAAIESVKMPTEAELLRHINEMEVPGVSSKVRSWNLVKRLKAVGLFIIAAAILANYPQAWLLWVPLTWASVTTFFNKSSMVNKLREDYLHSCDNFERATLRWRKDCGFEELAKTKSSLEQAKDNLEHLPKELGARLASYLRNRHSHQLHDYLDQFQISDAKISGIGAAKRAALASYGIETAADVKLDKVMQVSGFGPINSRPLIAWRDELEAKFVYSTHQNNLDSQINKTFEADIESKAKVLRTLLANGARDLYTAAQQVQAKSHLSDDLLRKLHHERVQLRADLQYLKGDIPQHTSAAITAQSHTSSQLPASRSSAAPLCPDCNGPMVRRVARRGRRKGKSFFGCSRYPRCTGAVNS